MGGGWWWLPPDSGCSDTTQRRLGGSRVDPSVCFWCVGSGRTSIAVVVVGVGTGGYYSYVNKVILAPLRVLLHILMVMM